MESVKRLATKNYKTLLISAQRIGYHYRIDTALTNQCVLVQDCCRTWEYELKTKKCLLISTVKEKMEQEENKDTVIGPSKCEGGKNIEQLIYFIQHHYSHS